MTLLRDDLIGQNRNQDRNADDIRQGPGMDHHQTGSHADQTEHNVQLLKPIRPAAMRNIPPKEVMTTRITLIAFTSSPMNSMMGLYAKM